MTGGPLSPKSQAARHVYHVFLNVAPSFFLLILASEAVDGGEAHRLLLTPLVGATEALVRRRVCHAVRSQHLRDDLAQSFPWSPSKRFPPSSRSRWMGSWPVQGMPSINTFPRGVLQDGPEEFSKAAAGRRFRVRDKREDSGVPRRAGGRETPPPRGQVAPAPSHDAVSGEWVSTSPKGTLQK